MCLGFSLQAQSIQVSNLAIDDEGKVSFRYSVAQKYTGRESYQLQVFTSADEFKSAIPLTLAPVAAGETKSVSFDGPELIGDYAGPLQFKFTVEATKFPVRITSTENKFKSGKSITISWEDYHESGWYDVELYEGGYISKTLASNYRGKLLSTSLPKKMTKGTYEVRVTPTNNKDLASDDFPVTIAAGGGAGVFILAGGALAGAGVFVLTQPDNPDSLPNPPDPGGN